MYTYSFEKLEVWIEFKELSKSIYALTKKFPSDEKFGLISQLRRASVSICSNIAEGSARKTNKDKAHFTTMAFSSAVEVLNQIIISYELNYINSEKYFALRKSIESITNKLNALRAYQINK
ncbi:four helix bundle protein [Olleya sp. YS]|uniref:four helix bundle protein n=1 Tax=Olleya sp. YS TaxID=3028318 RepID=UPI0024344B8D|nr:four helix bundle protein [Olleya sp. YS]WGD35070.1 four helix bundle protein [Olleya sp. YS]